MSWKTRLFQSTNTATSATVEIAVAHGEIDWDFIRSIYGWAAVQYQSWARGTVYNHASEEIMVALHAPGVIDLVIDGATGLKPCFGVDFYGFQRAPIITKLKPGPNAVHVRLIRDVRASGGQMPPLIEASVHIETVEGDASILDGSLVIPEICQGRFVAAFGSLTVVNHGSKALYIESIIINAPDKGAQTTKQQLWIVPGQSRPVQFRMDSIRDPGSDFIATVFYRKGSDAGQLQLAFQVKSRTREEAQRITFRHPSGVVSYALLLPPSKKVVERHKGPLPVMVALHGSAVDPDSDQIRHSFDGAPDLPAWLLFPTGMSPWCGDDWHTWGMADIDAALEAIPAWIDLNNWKEPGALTDRFLIAGHSNGGHGTWNYVLKRPDRIIAAAPASGYISVENYVPLSMWDDVDPAHAAVVSAARAAFRQELFLENVRDKPVLVQHGELDDNVPAYHSRLMKSYSMLQRGVELDYAEIPAKLHWWDGAMTTKPMLHFYLEQLAPPVPHAETPSKFSFVVADTHEFGSVHGIHVVQLLKPDVLGRVSVDTKQSDNTKTWKINTWNVRRIRLERSGLWSSLTAVQFDGEPNSFSIANIPESGCFTYDGEQWRMEDNCGDAIPGERTGKQRGSLDAILRTDGPFQIIQHSAEAAAEIALQVSRNLLQYFGADSIILNANKYTAAVEAGGNIISVCLATTPPQSQLKGFPITIDNGVVRVRGSAHQHGGQKIRNASSAIWMQPLSDERLELVVWGVDEAALHQAARLVPTITGAGQPNFVIFEVDGVSGVGGKVAAMGFFDFAWNVSAASYVP